MDRNAFMERLLSLATEKGAEGAEAYYARGTAFEANVLSGELDRYSVSRGMGVSVRVQVNGRDGYAYTELLDDPEKLVERAMENAACLFGDEPHPLQSPQTYRDVTPPASPLHELSEGERIDLALALERATLRADPRVKRVSACCVETGEGEIAIRNTAGLSAGRRKRFACCYVSPGVEEGGEVQTGLAFRMGPDAADAEGCAREAVEDALSRLGGKPVPSGTYRVLLKNRALADLLRAFSPMFSAEQAQKGCSLLAGKEGALLAAPLVNLADDPFDPVSPRAFDGEGTPCQRTPLIAGGRLVTLLHNLKTGRKAGVPSTGNASRATTASPVDVAPAVLTLEIGAGDLPALMRKLGDGLLITDLQGLHAGLSTVSGDFSLKAGGRLVKDGLDAGPVTGITVAGNFLALLQSVTAVGADAAYGAPSGVSVKCPSVLIENLQVAGK